MTTKYQFGVATLKDIPGILALQDSNVIDRGGGLSVRQTADWFKFTIHAQSQVGFEISAEVREVDTETRFDNESQTNCR
jgi:hypothetical protein